MVDSLCRFHVQSSISLSGKLDIFIIQKLKGKKNKRKKRIKVVDMLFLHSEEEKVREKGKKFNTTFYKIALNMRCTRKHKITAIP